MCMFVLTRVCGKYICGEINGQKLSNQMFSICRCVLHLHIGRMAPCVNNKQPKATSFVSFRLHFSGNVT